MSAARPMNAPTQTVHSLLLPLHGLYLVLPQPTIAEIAPCPGVRPIENAPDWLLGVFQWRAEQVPLISFEKLCGEAGEASKKSRYVAVLYGLFGTGILYYAIELKAIPHPALLNPASFSSENSKGDGAIAADVRIGGHRAVIPDLNRIERMITDSLARA